MSRLRVALLLGLALCSASTPVRAQHPKRKHKPAAAPQPAEAAETAPVEGTQAAPGDAVPREPAPVAVAAPAAPSPQAAPAPSGAEQLAQYLALLDKKKLAPAPATRVEELDELLEAAHQRTLAGRSDEATMMLLEAVEGPRFRAFEGLDSFAAADLMLASALLEQGALAGAQRSVDRLLARGPETATFGPAFRRGVDIALARGDYAASARALAKESLPQDARDELHYLNALAEPAKAQAELAAIGKHSRFYARAQYLLGAQAAAHARYEEADARFAAARTLGPRTRYASEHFDASEDLAQLGRARVAHERGESKLAHDLYFRVPNDSPWLAEALFESAYASYERGRPELAIDSLAQLAARYPNSPYTAEARVLRGYVLLASFDFELAERELSAFEQTFGGVLREIDATLESEGQLRSLFDEQREGLPAEASKHDALLRGLLVRDPAVEHLQRELAALDAELARGGQLDGELEALAARVRGQDLPRARNDDEELRAQTLRERAEALREAVIAFADELRALERGGAKPEELAELKRTQRKLIKASDRIEAALRAEERVREAPAPSGVELGKRLDEERVYTAAMRSRAFALRERLHAALIEAERAALRRLRARVELELRRARLG
ncbi:MAG TPA: hypothetical protein VI299_10925, partial [Polyangiales bacterium]